LLCRELADKTRDIIRIVRHVGVRKVSASSLSVAAQVDGACVPAQITQLPRPEHPNTRGIGGAVDQDYRRPIAHNMHDQSSNTQQSNAQRERRLQRRDALWRFDWP
jgi:hypothetical protein